MIAVSVLVAICSAGKRLEKLYDLMIAVMAVKVCSGCVLAKTIMQENLAQWSENREQLPGTDCASKWLEIKAAGIRLQDLSNTVYD